MTLKLLLLNYHHLNLIVLREIFTCTCVGFSVIIVTTKMIRMIVGMNTNDKEIAMFTNKFLQDLSIDDVRMLLGGYHNPENSAKAFIRERFLRIQALDSIIPVPVSDGALVMHLVPLVDFEAKRKNKIPALGDLNTCFSTIQNNFSRGINLEGYFFSDSENNDYTQKSREYTQVFRDGSLEAVSIAVLRHGRPEKPGFGATVFPKTIVSALNRYMRGLRENGVKPSILLQISTMNFQNIKMMRDNYENDIVCNRKVLHLPSSLIMEYDLENNYTNVAMEQMDFLWNAFGLERCTYGPFEELRKSA